MTHARTDAAAIARWLIPAPARLTLHDGLASIPPDARDWASRGADVLSDANPARDPWRTEDVTGAWCSADDRDGQGYSLDIRPDATGSLHASIRARSIAGLRCARATLLQLIRASSAGAIDQCPRASLPTCTIDDQPAFARRGVMLDVSRCRVPTMEHLFALIDTLALLKCNHFQLYIEHTFAYSFAQDVWTGWSPITPEELRAIDAHCASRGVELAANQNCFGHLRNWLETPAFASLAETHGDWMFDVWPRSGAFSLCPTDPASIRFVRTMLEEMLPCVRSGWVNIGCDETYDIAFGRSKDACARDGREIVYARFVRDIVDVARSLGKRSMFWGDIALTHPQCLELIPADATLLAWGYEPSTPFADWCEAARTQGRPARDGVFMGPPRDVWVCPGTATWRAITGRTRERRANLDRAAREGAAHGASGFLVCEWGDCGHWQQPALSLRALADAMDAAWAGHIRDNAPAASMHALGELNPNAAALATLIDTLGDADAPLRQVCGGLSRADRTAKPLPNATALYADLYQPWAADASHAGTIDQWRDAHARLSHAAAALADLSISPRTRDELAHTIRLAQWAASRALARRSEQHSPQCGADPWPHRNDLPALKAEHARLWREVSREGGLAQSLEFFDRIDLGGNNP